MVEISINKIFHKKLKWKTFFQVFLILWIPFSASITFDYFYGLNIRREKNTTIDY